MVSSIANIFTLSRLDRTLIPFADLISVVDREKNLYALRITEYNEENLKLLKELALRYDFSEVIHLYADYKFFISPYSDFKIYELFPNLTKLRITSSETGYKAQDLFKGVLKNTIIHFITYDLVQLHQLEVLAIAHLIHGEFPIELAKLKKLKCLGLANNEFRYIPPIHQGFDSLKHIGLVYNHLEEFPTPFQQLGLDIIDTRDNPFMPAGLKMDYFKKITDGSDTSPRYKLNKQIDRVDHFYCFSFIYNNKGGKT